MEMNSVFSIRNELMISRVSVLRTPISAQIDEKAVATSKETAGISLEGWKDVVVGSESSYHPFQLLQGWLLYSNVRVCKM